MTATLTARRYAVAWDDPAEVDAAIGGGPFRARLQLDPQTGALLRWNGFVLPHFDRAEVERYVAFIAAQPEGHAYGRVEFRGDTLVLIDVGADEAIAPTELGLYPLGAFGWTWQIVEPDHDPGDPTLAGDHDYVDDGAGRCAARPLGGGRYPVCGQWAENAVHTEPVR